MIPLKFVNLNRFEILYPINYFIPFNIIPLDEKNLKTKLLSNNKIINKEKNSNLFINEYVEFNHIHKNKYNEVYKFLSTGKFPERIEQISCKKKHKKRNKFRNDANANYIIKENRLFYKMKRLKKTIEIRTILQILKLIIQSQKIWYI